MDAKTMQSYEAAIEKQRNLIAEMERDEEWESAEYAREHLDDLVDEYDYLKNDEAAFQRYLEQQGGEE